MKREARAPSNWIDLGFDSWQMMNDAAAVIWLRTEKIARGGMPAANEAHRMISEKVEANTSFLIDLATGAAGVSPQAVASNAVGMYGRKIRANRRRLTR